MNSKILLINLSLILFLNSPVLADEIAQRAKIAKNISELVTTSCRMEEADQRKELELISILILHGETKEARAKMQGLKTKVSTDFCRKALLQREF